MTVARYIVGSAVHEMLAMPAGSVDLVVTSPPFLGLRDYLDPADPLKAWEHGRCSTPTEFLHELIDMVDAAGHVLARHGSLVIELGDSMAGSGGAGGDYYNAHGIRADQPKPPGSAKLSRRRNGDGQSARPHRFGSEWPDDKSLAMIPEMLRIAMAYGELPFDGRPVERWLIRNVVRWCKPNPSVGDEGDKFRRGCNDMLVATKAPDRYWDKLAARRPSRTKAGEMSPMLDWWEMPTGQFKGGHYATFPLDLVAPLVQTMCPPKVCQTCGEPQRRIIRKTDEYAAARSTGDMYASDGANDRATGRNGAGGHPGGMVAAQYEHVGWTDCEHGDWRRGVVLDPYAGSGSTLSAATGAGRDAIGIDLDQENAALALDRIGPMFLTVEAGHAHVT